MPIRVLLSDDHPAILDALAAVLHTDPALDVVGTASTAKATLDADERLQPDVAIVDLTYQHEPQGFDLVRTLHQRRPSRRVLVFTMHNELLHAATVLKLGAAGYVMKSAPVRTVKEAVHRVVQGEVVTSADVARSILRNLVPGAEGDQTASALRRLSPQERLVFGCLGEGLSTDRIAERLGIGRKTAQTHRRRVQQKLGFSDAAELGRFAVLVATGSPPPVG